MRSTKLIPGSSPFTGKPIHVRGSPWIFSVFEVHIERWQFESQ